MNKIFLMTLAIVSTMACKQKDPIVVNYHQTKKVDTVDNYFGTEVKDPYRWLEDDMSEETGEWVKAQNAVTFEYLDTIPFRSELKERLESLWNYEKVGPPFEEGDYTYYY
ncbi:MAG: S9 family peptidase, partial [Flavobacteriaceae bacterium]|nr:S9 family peptidase [Flavobacteriaceae bacterium]